MSYLIYNTEAEALAKADEEGKHRNYPYHRPSGGITRHHTLPEPTYDNKFALDVSEYETLTAEELAATVSTFTPLPID
jgi:hypothetical protein